MKKIFILFTIFTSIAFGGSDKTIVKYDPNSWQNGHFLERTEWGKKVTQSENCQLSKEGKLYQIHSIGLNVMKEDPAIWLNGKYLEFINSRCNLKETYTIRGTTKEDFDKLVNRDNNMITKNNNSNSYLGGLLAGIIFVFGIFSLIRRFLWGAN